MYLINKEHNSINKIPEKSFSELGFKERKHLQEWLAKNPEALDEELLIIQKEFQGFNDTNERLDLLALDKQGNLVIIENKLDDTGKDVTWQVLKYASYCSSLSKSQITKIFQDYLNKNNNNANAEQKLKDFFDNEDYEEISLNKGQTQRIILVAANFRKEVTSTVLWLLNYKLRIQCFKICPYELHNQLFLKIEQIIPMKGNEDYIISMAEKTQDDIITQEELKTRHIIRQEFWQKLLIASNKNLDLFNNISPSKEGWIASGSGIGGITYNFAIAHNYCRVELYISKSKEDNKFFFDELYKQKDKIEEKFGNKLEWERLDEKKASRIKFEMLNVNVFNKEDWEKMIDFLINSMIKLEKAFSDALKTTSNIHKSKNK